MFRYYLMGLVAWFIVLSLFKADAWWFAGVGCSYTIAFVVLAMAIVRSSGPKSKK